MLIVIAPSVEVVLWVIVQKCEIFPSGFGPKWIGIWSNLQNTAAPEFDAATTMLHCTRGGL